MIYSLENLKQEAKKSITINIEGVEYKKEIAWNTGEDVKNLIGASLYTAVAFYEAQYQAAKTEKQKFEAFTKLEQAKSDMGMGIVNKRAEIINYFFGVECANAFAKFPDEVQIQICLDAMGQMNNPSGA